MPRKAFEAARSLLRGGEPQTDDTGELGTKDEGEREASGLDPVNSAGKVAAILEADQAKEDSLKLWSPGVPALAVWVRESDRVLDWDQCRNRLAKRLQDLADQVGNNLSLASRGVPSAVDAAEFQELLAERHNLRPEDFPMLVKGPFEDSQPSNLAEWVRDVK